MNFWNIDVVFIMDKKIYMWIQKVCDNKCKKDTTATTIKWEV